MDFRKIVELDSYLRIAHHTPGRIRVKFSLAAATHPTVRSLLNESPEPPKGVISSKINPLARSVVIEYDPKIIDPKLLELLINGKDREEKIRVLEEFHAQHGA